jgi:hypothetical protein
MKRKSKRGGAREGSGRKPYSNRDDVRTAIVIYPKFGSIKKCGGEEEAGIVALDAIENFDPKK